MTHCGGCSTIKKHALALEEQVNTKYPNHKVEYTFEKEKGRTGTFRVEVIAGKKSKVVFDRQTSGGYPHKFQDAFYADIDSVLAA